MASIQLILEPKKFLNILPSCIVLHLGICLVWHKIWLNLSDRARIDTTKFEFIWVCICFDYWSFMHWHCSAVHTFHWRFNQNAKHIWSLNFCNLFAKFHCFSNILKFINHTTGLNKWNAFYIHFEISICICCHQLLQKKSEQRYKIAKDFTHRLLCRIWFYDNYIVMQDCYIVLIGMKYINTANLQH